MAEVIRLSKAKREVFLTTREKFVKLVLMLKTIKQGNNDGFLENMQQEKCAYWF